MKTVSAIMPTRGRPEFAEKALHSFLEQSYPMKQLIILDDSDDPSFRDGSLPTLMEWEQITYARISGLNIPSKRNLCCASATGEIIMHFDSDDWSAKERMADQVARLEDSQKQVTGYHSMLFYHVEKQSAFKYHGAKWYAIGTSLTYFRSWWEKHPFPEDKTIGEDNAIVAIAHNSGQLTSVDAGDMLVARIHAGNSSPKDLNGTNFIPAPMVQLPRGFF